MSDRAAAIALLRDSTLAVRESTLTSWCEALASGMDISARQSPQAARRNPSGTLGTVGFVGPVFHRPNILSFSSVVRQFWRHAERCRICLRIHASKRWLLNSTRQAAGWMA
jgi:hypothetical protein